MQRAINPRAPRDVSAGIAMSGVPLNAAILEPTQDRAVPAGRVRVRGWAMGSEGRPPTAVEVSPNGGEDWVPARITIDGASWTWSLCEATVDLAPGRHTLAARTTDGTGATQPRTLGETWNVKGYGNNAWHRVAVHAE